MSDEFEGDAVHVERAYLDALESHYAAHFGQPAHVVFHEIRSHKVHVDVHVYDASVERPYITIATSGMSALPMAVPEDLRHYDKFELLTYLPADWDFEGVLGVTPVTMLTATARYPHLTGKWLGYEHTLETHDKPIVPGSLLTTLYFLGAPEVASFDHLELPDGTHTHFMWVVPLTDAESYVARTKGRREITQLLIDNAYLEMDIDRACMVSSESRAQRRAREKAQKHRSKMQRVRPLTELHCEMPGCVEHG